MDDYREALRLAGITSHELVFERRRAGRRRRPAWRPDAARRRTTSIPRSTARTPHPTTEVVAAPRDAYEIALVKAAIARDLPIFAICRGIQLLNVALGGTLVQDIPTQVLQHLDHQPGGEPSMIGHYVEVTPGTRLAELVEAELERDGFCAVNSRHHQALKKLGEGLKVTASSVDGVIEAVERPASRFCVAVQWHPESFWPSGRFQGLFRGFLAAAQETRIG